MRISVVIPALDEIEELPTTIPALLSLDTSPDEIVIADGGSSDGTVAWIEAFDDPRVRIVRAPRGRGAQMNAGAAVATGDVLVFLHADARFAPTALERIRQALETPGVAGGAFTIRFAPRADAPRSMPLVAAGINARTRVTRSATGDQGIFTTRSTFERMGGYREWPLFEDVDMVTRLKREGRFVIVRDPVAISDRRYAKFGPLRTTILMWILRLRYWAGESPENLKRAFPDVRPQRAE